MSLAFDPKKFKADMIKEAEESIDKDLDKVADFIHGRAVQNIHENGTSDTGLLADKSGVMREFLKKIVYFAAPYAPFIEYGTDPHAMNPEVLYTWVRRKLGIKGKANIKKVAGGIAWKIYHYGTEAQPFLRPAINEFLSRGISGIR